MGPSGYYARDTRVMIQQSPVHSSGKKGPQPAVVEREVTEIATSLNDRVSETTGTTVRVTNFDVTYSRHEDLRLRVNQIDDPEIPLRNICNNHVLFLIQSFCAYAFGHARRTLLVTNTARKTGSEAC